jgi:hypothetical protein
MTEHDHPEPETAAVDLTPLAPLQLDAARSDALLARVRAAAAPGLERRANAARASGRRTTAAREVERVIARFTWAAMAAAAAGVLLVTRLDGTTDTGSTTVTASVAQAVTETDSTTNWIAQQAVPTDAELAVALGWENAQ